MPCPLVLLTEAIVHQISFGTVSDRWPDGSSSRHRANVGPWLALVVEGYPVPTAVVHPHLRLIVYGWVSLLSQPSIPRSPACSACKCRSVVAPPSMQSCAACMSNTQLQCAFSWDAVHHSWSRSAMLWVVAGRFLSLPTAVVAVEKAPVPRLAACFTHAQAL